MRVTVERSIDCASEPAALWPFISDTERLNRAAGLGALELAPNDAGGAARFVVKTVSGGFPLEYEERPFEWVENERFVVRRIVRKGLANDTENAFELAPLPNGGTRLTVRVSVDPKLRALSPVVKLQVGRIVDRMLKELERIDAELSQGRPSIFKLPSSNVAGEALERARTAFDGRVKAGERELAARLVQFVSLGPDADVSRIRPFELADRWHADRRRVLALCLEGVRAGLLELSWEIVCPSCRTASNNTPVLKDLPPEGHCQLCDISFEIELDRAVEATFRPARGLRPVDQGPYCIGGPARTPHVFAQSVIAANGAASLPVPAEAARYRVFARGGAVASLEVVDGAPTDATLELKADAFAPAAVRLAPGGRLEIVQRAGPERHVKLERLEYASLAATAHLVSTIPEFRREFASDVLRPGLTLRVAKSTLLFTDLTNSTALYTAVGDARAFSLVQAHFELIAGIVEGHDGAIVKTIGDAVMAAFVREADAVRAAVAMQRAFPEFRRDREHARESYLKIGVYAGPCYVVTANGILDYFGQSVNVAARLQSAANAGEIVMHHDLAGAARAAGWLDGAVLGDRFEATLKGLPEPVPAVRVIVDPDPADAR
jgi:adenylate cyclase